MIDELGLFHAGRMPTFDYLRDDEVAAVYLFLATYPPMAERHEELRSCKAHDRGPHTASLRQAERTRAFSQRRIVRVHDDVSTDGLESSTKQLSCVSPIDELPIHATRRSKAIPP